jgi:3-isopropylmalate/(R)-2-methylmalate dehydratase large subunit
MSGHTLYDKLLQAHTIRREADGTALVLIDRIVLHERTGAVALTNMAEDGRKVLNPSTVFSTIDHIADTKPGRPDVSRMPGGQVFIDAMRLQTQAAGLRLFDIDDERQGIVHVIAPEQGIALPGLTMVCPDSHTCTLGGLGALAWGIGSTEAEHALITQTLWVPPKRQMRIWLDGDMVPGVGAKDVILALIARYSARHAVGYVIEFAGPVVDAMEVEARLTLCNMAVEFGAFTALIAPDDRTLAFVAGRPFGPNAGERGAAEAFWQTLRTDRGASFDQEIVFDVSDLSPMVSWGTSPEEALAIGTPVPAASDYMDLAADQPLLGAPIDTAFIGSCTNARLSDLRRAADILRGRHVAEGVLAICVPGSTATKAAAEAEGLDRVFTDAGFEWRDSGCSMCFYAGGEGFGGRKRVISSTNRNFEGRQGPKARTHIASPETVAWSAVQGHIADVRDALTGGS